MKDINTRVDLLETGWDKKLLCNGAPLTEHDKLAIEKIIAAHLSKN